jgi:hypothetical protein
MRTAFHRQLDTLTTAIAEMCASLRIAGTLLPRLGEVMYQLRKYTLKDRESLDFFRNVVYPRHFVSFAKFGMATHGLWTALDPNDLTLYVLFSFAEKDDPAAVLAELVKSDEFQADLVGWDNNANIPDYTDTFMTPGTASPLR